MAGMLPGVEAARRRRFHHRNLNYGSEISSSPVSRFSTASRRSTFCLYAISSYVFHSNSSMKSNIPVGKQPHRFCDDESTLCAAAREAKKRLDERLQPQRILSQTKRVQSRIAPQQRSSSSTSTSFSGGGPQYSSSDNMPKAQATKLLKKKNWLKLMRWKSSEQEEQEECAVCLEQLRGGETLMQLPCGHRFHTKCLVPWLDGNINAHCPCCRMEIPP